MEDFEWDDTKSDTNIDKHGIDFEDAIVIFEGRCLLKRDDRVDYGEERMIALGEAFGHVLAVVYTMRGDVCRIISARKANRHERTAYHEAIAAGSSDGTD